MKIERYISLLVVLAVALFLVNAQAQAATVSANVPCPAPANTWCYPATSGAGVTGTFCTTSVPDAYIPAPAPVKAARPTVTYSETPWEVLGSVLATPFVIGQCVLAGCP